MRSQYSDSKETHGLEIVLNNLRCKGNRKYFPTQVRYKYYLNISEKILAVRI